MGLENDNGHIAPKGMRFWFGILMILVYLGLGLLFILNVFDNNVTVSRIVGWVLIIYGIYRGYRLYAATK